jgi:hypothetical protein
MKNTDEIKEMGRRPSRLLLVITLSLFFMPGVYAVDEQAGWPKNIGGMVASSPVMADLDLDGDYEVVIGSEDGTVYVWQGDGSSLAGWPAAIGYNVISTPAVGDVNGDGDLDIVGVSTQTGVNAPKSKIYAWNLDGSTIWTKTITTGVVSSPALGDIDADGDLEIVVGAEDNNIYAWNSDGTDVTGWPISTGGEILNSPAMADLDEDGDLEIVAGSADGSVYAWHHDGTLYWSMAIGPVYESSPAAADIDGDGALEIVIGSESGLHAINHDGTLLWSNSIGSTSSPALGDINADGALEIVVGTSSLAPANEVHLLSNDGTVVWSKQLGAEGMGEYREIVGSSPAIGDLDGDGSVEIIVATIATFGDGGYIYAWDNAGNLAWSALMGGAKFTTTGSSPAAGDIDGDGDIEVVAGSIDGKVHAWDFTGSYDPDNIKWAMFRHDARHLGTLVLTNNLNIVGAQTDETSYIRGDNIIISCNVLDHYGFGTSADSVRAVVNKPDGTTETVALDENAIGDYSGTFTGALQAGQYTMTIHADRSGYESAAAPGPTVGVSNPPFWHYRIPVDVDAGASERVDAPIVAGVNFTQKLQDMGIAGTFDINSPRVYETDAAGSDLQEVPSEFKEQVGTSGTTNIAPGKTATASTELKAIYGADKAIDEDSGTLWAGTGNNNDWLKIDLGELTFISKVVLAGYKSDHYLTDFKIQVSTDDVSYTTVATVTGNTLLTSEHQFTPAYGRYVKLVVTLNTGHWRTVVREFEIYSVTGSSYNAQTNAVGDLKWIMDGATPAGTTRYYNLYFDLLENGTKEAPAYGVDYSALTMPSGITVTQGLTEVREELNLLPIAAITSPGDGSVHTLGDSIAFTGTGTDYDGSIISYEWTSGLDGILSTASSFSASELSLGTHLITFKVTDDDGVADSAQITVKVNSPPSALIVLPVDGSVHSPSDTISFEATGTDTDGTVVAYSWTSDVEGVLSTTNSFGVTGLSIGTHTITLTVTDDDGATASAQATMRINSPPTAAITQPASGAIYSQEDTTTFEGTATDTDGTITSYEWASDVDGTLSTQSTFSTSSLSVGTHTITLTATDNNGATDTASITVEQRGYLVEWLINKDDIRLGSTVPLKFNVTQNGAFVADESVIVKVLDPEGTEVFNAAYVADDATRADTDVRINSTEEQYITNFHSQRDAPTGTYTFKVEFASDRPGSVHSTTIDIHTRLSIIISDIGGGISRLISAIGGGAPPEEDKPAEIIPVPAEEKPAPIKPTIIKGYDLEWLFAKKTQRPGSTVPISFTLRSPKTKGFVIDDSVTVRIYDPDGSGVYMATYAGDGVRLDTRDEVYSTRYETPKDAPTGTYTVKVEVEGEAEDYETTVDVHTRTSQVVDSVAKFFKGLFGG